MSAPHPQTPAVTKAWYWFWAWMRSDSSGSARLGKEGSRGNLEGCQGRPPVALPSRHSGLCLQRPLGKHLLVG